MDSPTKASAVVTLDSLLSFSTRKKKKKPKHFSETSILILACNDVESNKHKKDKVV